VPEEVSRVSLREEAAFQLANVTKTAPQFGAITPRWLVRFLDWKPLEAGTFRVNKVDESKVIESLCAHEDESPLPTTFADYQDTPREIVWAASMPYSMCIRAFPICSAIPTIRFVSNCAFLSRA
jgi:hypothetical protein